MGWTIQMGEEVVTFHFLFKMGSPVDIKTFFELNMEI